MDFDPTPALRVCCTLPNRARAHHEQRFCKAVVTSCSDRSIVEPRICHASRLSERIGERLASAEELMTIDAHARPSGDAPEPLYDVTVPTPTHAERARTLVAGISTGTLCTIAVEPAGYPYGSFVTVAFDEGDPVSLISALAEHTRNLERDPRAS